MRAYRVASLMMLWSLGCAMPVAAQSVAISQTFETSIRAAGMGGATTAVTWGEPGPWGNPASLSGTRGLAWLAGNTDVGQGFYGDVKFESRRFLAGGAGIGFSLMGKPVNGMGHSRLEFGKSEGTDPFGNPVSHDIYEEIDGWGVGLSPIQLMDAWRANRDPDARPWTQRLDVSIGYQQKETEVVLTPGDGATADNYDWGVQATYALLPGDTEGHEARIELGVGYAVLNADEQSSFDFPVLGSAEPSRMERTGVALHATLPFSGTGDAGGEPWGWWFATVPRALEIGLAYDRESVSNSASLFTSEGEVDHVGFEASLMGLLTGRIGYVNEPHNEINGMSLGFGLHLPIGPWAGVGYDWAIVPQPNGIDAQTRNGFAVWLHPVSFWKTTR